MQNEKELKIKKKVDSIELSQNEFNILKSNGQNGNITEEIKTILNKVFTGIDSTNITKILYSLNESENKIILKAIEDYYFEGKPSSLNVLYTVLSKDNINIAITVKDKIDKIEKIDMDNILGSDNTAKIKSLEKIFGGITDKNINLFNIEKVTNSDSTIKIKLTAIKGYIFNNVSTTLFSNNFSVFEEVTPPPPIGDQKLNITAKTKVEGPALTEPDLREIYSGYTPDEDKLKILSKVFDGITIDNIKNLKSDYIPELTQIYLVANNGYVFSDNSKRLNSVVFPKAQKVLINASAKVGEIIFTDQDAEDMKSKDNKIKLKALSKVFDGLTIDNIKGITEPLLGNFRDTIHIYRSYGYIFPNDKTVLISNEVKGISKLILIKPVQYPEKVFKDDFKNITNPKISPKEKLNILLKFFKPESDWYTEFDSADIISTNDKITLKAKKGYIFIKQTTDGPNVPEITSNIVSSYATTPTFLNIGLVPKTKTITKQDISDFNDPNKKLSILNKYFTNITASNMNNFSASINTYKTAITLRANSGYSLGEFTQVNELDSWWNLPERGTNPTTGANPVPQWMPRQQNEGEAAPERNRDNIDKSNYPFKWLSSTPQKPTEFPKLSADEQKVVDFYKNTTARISSPVWVDNEEYEESGTIWYYPKPDWDKTNEWTYFGTNIHVIGNILTKTKLPNSKQKPVHGFYLLEDQRHKDITLNFARDKQLSINDRAFIYSADVSQGEIELVDLALDTSSNYDINGKNRSMIDFAVLRVKTVGKNLYGESINIEDHVNKTKNLTYDWVDTEQEFKEIFENVQDLTFYVGGYPSGFWTIKSYTRNQFWTPQTTTLPIKSGTKWYTDPNLSQYDAVRLGGEEWYSMSNSLMFPNFPIGHGGSGSLVTILHKGVVRPVGIFWGDYAHDSFTNQNIMAMGGADLFYTPNFFFKNQTTSAPSYDFTKVKNIK
ncbi:MAG: hypothetical protein ACRCRP_02845 [Metamycoplasmataceae bacterium]